MDINARFEVSVWGVLGVIGSTAIVVAGATWGLAKTTESNELQAYKASKEWKAAEAIASLQELSKTVKLETDERNDLIRMRSLVPDLERSLSETKKQLTQAVDEKLALQASLASIVKRIDQVEIPLRDSRFVIPNTLPVGVTSIYSTRCSVRVGDKTEMLEVGQSTDVPFAGRNYRLSLLRITETTCTLSFSERPS